MFIIILLIILTKLPAHLPMQIDFAAECDKFEKGLGSIFRNAWQHVEVLQTTDLPLLLTHIAETLQAALDLPEIMDALILAGDLHQRQEVLVFYYQLGLLKHIEELGESRLEICLPYIHNLPVCTKLRFILIRIYHINLVILVISHQPIHTRHWYSSLCMLMCMLLFTG